jgi:hypothetical protein
MAKFSISRWMRRFVRPPAYTNWHLARVESFTLEDVVGCGKTTNGRYVYIVNYDQRPIYVGKSTRSLRQRTMEHIRTRSRLGVFMGRAAPADWNIDVYHIEGDLRVAEIYYIDQLEPPLNRQNRGAP